MAVISNEKSVSIHSGVIRHRSSGSRPAPHRNSETAGEKDLSQPVKTRNLNRVQAKQTKDALPGDRTFQTRRRANNLAARPRARSAAAGGLGVCRQLGRP